MERAWGTKREASATDDGWEAEPSTHDGTRLRPPGPGKPDPVAWVRSPRERPITSIV